MEKVMIGVCKFCAREQPELNLSCIGCNKREWARDKKNVNAIFKIDQTIPNKQKIKFNFDNPMLYS